MADAEDDWETPHQARPQPSDYAFDLDRALASVVGLRARTSPDAFTAEALGSERAGNAVLIGEDGVVLTIGYLIAEAEEIWLTTETGRVAPGHLLGYDPATGFGLVQALGRLDIPVLPLGDSRGAAVGQRVVIGAAGGRRRAIAAHIVARREFAGYWEYVLDEALFTAPAHPNWGGTAVIGPKGDLLGIGSLQVPQQIHGDQVVPLNMAVPIELLAPIFDDLRTLGRPNGPPRPWLGLLAAEVESKIVVIGFAGDGPARRAGLHEGDVILAVGGVAVFSLAGFFRRIWALGHAGVEAPLTLDREGDVFEVRVNSADRQRFFKTARLH